jgi:mRNA interferase RelE/StbE
VKRVVYTPRAQRALVKHRADAKRIVAKVKAYAASPEAFAKVKTLKGIEGKRLRVGDFRILFTETEEEVVVTAIGPRGDIYD